MVTHVQAVAPDATRVHCSIHREALAAKGIPNSLKDVLDTTVKKMVQFVKIWPLNSCIFCTMQWYGQRPCNAFITYGSALVIKGQSIYTFFKLRDELKVFFTDHNFHLSDCLHDEEFLTQPAYLGEIFSHLNDLNLGFRNYFQCAGQNWGYD